MHGWSNSRPELARSTDHEFADSARIDRLGDKVAGSIGALVLLILIVVFGSPKTPADAGADCSRAA
jgi:hypothetical protein